MLFSQIRSPVIQLLQLHRPITAAGTACLVLDCSSFTQMLSCNCDQRRESICSVMYVTSGKVKTSVQQSPCVFDHGDSSCATALCSIAHRVGALSMQRLSPTRNHPSLPVPRQQHLNVGTANIVHPSLKLCISPNNHFYILYIKNIILQFLVSHNLHMEFQGGYLIECMPQLLYVCVKSKGLGNLA